ncbi:MAG: hypothetical protein GC156_06320 [Actinomycetales bacterium]|nr:hypothetical protein [Actinomycetales bacterium]
MQSRLHGFKSRLHLHVARAGPHDRAVVGGHGFGATIDGVNGLWTSGYARLAILTSIATLAAYLIGVVVPFADPIPAAITAVVSTKVTFHHAAKEGSFQILGTMVGAAIALGVVSLIGSGAIVLFIIVLLSFAIAWILRFKSPDEAPFMAATVAITMILVVGTHLTTEGALARFLGVAIGALCGLAASAVVAPAKDTRVLGNDVDALKEDLSALLTTMAKGIRETPEPATAREWREQATELRNRTLGLAARWEDLSSHARWSPRLHPDELARLKRELDATSVMSSRVLSIASDLSATGRSAAPLPPAAVSPLADLMAMAADNIAADDPTTSIGRTQAHEAVRLADQTAQIALVGGIVSNLNRINQASSAAHDPDSEDTHSAT